VSRSRQRPIVVLALVNAALAFALVIVALSRGAGAQGSVPLGRATYSMAGGHIADTDMGVVHIVDETHQEMVSLLWNDKQRTLVPVGYRNLAADSAGAGRLRP